MHVYHDLRIEKQQHLVSVRTHPWTSSAHDSSQKYVDFTRCPDLIEGSLEDFRPWRQYESVRAFFEWLRRLNRDGGQLESNDSGFGGIEANTRRDCPDGPATLRNFGRVMLLFRWWPANLVYETTQSMFDALQEGIAGFPSQNKAVVGLTFCPIMFPTLPGAPLGRQVAAHWWSWGDTTAEVMEGFHDIVRALGSSTALIESEIEKEAREAR